MATLCRRFDQGHNLSNHVSYSGMGLGAAIYGPYQPDLPESLYA
jgi:hypothetical protein